MISDDDIVIRHMYVDPKSFETSGYAITKDNKFVHYVLNAVSKESEFQELSVPFDIVLYHYRNIEKYATFIYGVVKTEAEIFIDTLKFYKLFCDTAAVAKEIFVVGVPTLEYEGQMIEMKSRIMQHRDDFIDLCRDKTVFLHDMTSLSATDVKTFETINQTKLRFAII